MSLGIYMFYKQGFPINPISIYTVLGFILFVINFSLITINSSNENNCKPIRWNKNPALILFLIILLFVTSGIFFKIELLTLVVASIGYGLFVRICLLVYKKENTILIVGFGILGSLLSIFITCMLFSIHISPLFNEELYVPDFEDGINWRIDTLYHIASAQMFNTYGIAGQGLDGVKYV